MLPMDLVPEYGFFGKHLPTESNAQQGMENSMDFDWKKVLPVIGAAVTGNVSGAILAAASALSGALGTPVPDTAEGIDTALKAATPEQLAALKTIDANLKIRFRELDTEDRRIDAASDAAVIDDVKDARKFNADTHGILYLGYGINVLSYVCVALILVGCFSVLTGAKMGGVDPGLAAMVGSVVGAVVQWLMSNAAQANQFFFGSSPGSRQVSADLAKAVGTATTKLK